MTTEQSVAQRVDAQENVYERAIDAIEQLIACHEEPTCPAISVGHDVVAMLRAALAADAVLTAKVLQEHPVMPLEATAEMIEAAFTAYSDQWDPHLVKNPDFAEIYREMCAAAPQPDSVGDTQAVDRRAIYDLACHGSAYVDEEDFQSASQAFEGIKKIVLTAPQPATVAAGETYMRDAYTGAREDLAIWQRRALEAERYLREEKTISSRLASEINAANGPTRMGEPAQPATVAALDVALMLAQQLVDQIEKLEPLMQPALTAQAEPSDELVKALRLAEAALSDIGDADREPGDDLAWCEKRAAQNLPAIRTTLARHTDEGETA